MACSPRVAPLPLAEVRNALSEQRRVACAEQTPLVPGADATSPNLYISSCRAVHGQSAARRLPRRRCVQKPRRLGSFPLCKKRLGPSHTTRNATRTGRATPGAEGNVALLRCRRRVVTRLVLPPRDWSRDATSHPTRTALVHKIVPVRDAPHRALPRSQALKK